MNTDNYNMDNTRYEVEFFLTDKKSRLQTR